EGQGRRRARLPRREDLPGDGPQRRRRGAVPQGDEGQPPRQVRRARGEGAPARVAGRLACAGRLAFAGPLACAGRFALARTLMPAPLLTGPGRFETLADDGERFHLRQSSLTEKTLLGYMLTCLVLAICLLVMGAQLIYQPRSTWLIFLVMPAGALWLLRYSGEVIADRTRRRVHVKGRTLGVWAG